MNYDRHTHTQIQNENMFLMLSVFFLVVLLLCNNTYPPNHQQAKEINYSSLNSSS